MYHVALTMYRLPCTSWRNMLLLYHIRRRTVPLSYIHETFGSWRSNRHRIHCWHPIFTGRRRTTTNRTVLTGCDGMRNLGPGTHSGKHMYENFFTLGFSILSLSTILIPFLHYRISFLMVLLHMHYICLQTRQSSHHLVVRRAIPLCAVHLNLTSIYVMERD